MAEWLNATVLKTVISRDRDREFESHSLHHSFSRLQYVVNQNRIEKMNGRPFFFNSIP